MRLTKKKIKKILEIILGEEGLPLVEELIEKDNISEFDLAAEINKDIKVVRKLLYILYNHNLVSFTRKKDKQKGWYIYYWTLILNNVKFSYYKMKRDLLERLKLRLKEEEEELFFICPNNCVRLNFDQAADFDFHCPECGELIAQDDSKKNIAAIKKRIVETEKELKRLKEKRKIRKIKIVKKKKEIKKRKVAKKKTVAKKKPVKKKVVKKKVTEKKVIKKTSKKSPKEKTTSKKKIVKKPIEKKEVKKKVTKKKPVKKKTTAIKIN